MVVNIQTTARCSCKQKENNEMLQRKCIMTETKEEEGNHTSRQTLEQTSKKAKQAYTTRWWRMSEH